MPRIYFIHDVTGGTGAYKGFLQTLESNYGWVPEDYEFIDAHGLAPTLEGEVNLQRELNFPVTEHVDPNDVDAVSKVKGLDLEPVVLVGYSSGAYYAYEMAKQLIDRGFPVLGLVVIDNEARLNTDPETSAKTLVGVAEYIAKKQYGLDLRLEMTNLLAKLSTMPVSEQGRVFFPALLENGVRADQTAYGRFKRFIAMLRSISKQVISYKIKPYINQDGQEGLPVNLLVVRAEHEDHTKVDDLLGWGAFIKEDDSLKESILLKGAEHLTVFDNMSKTFLTKFFQFCIIPGRSRSDSKDKESGHSSLERQVEKQQQQIAQLVSAVSGLQEQFELSKKLRDPSQVITKAMLADMTHTVSLFHKKEDNTSEPKEAAPRSGSAPIPVPKGSNNHHSPDRFTGTPAEGVLKPTAQQPIFKSYSAPK